MAPRGGTATGRLGDLVAVLGTGAIAITRPAPKRHVEVIASCPTGPQPKTATVSPRDTSASCAPNQAVGKMSESTMAWASVTAPGSGTRFAEA